MANWSSRQQFERAAKKIRGLDVEEFLAPTRKPIDLSMRIQLLEQLVYILFWIVKRDKLLVLGRTSRLAELAGIHGATQIDLRRRARVSLKDSERAKKFRGKKVSSINLRLYGEIKAEFKRLEAQLGPVPYTLAVAAVAKRHRLNKTMLYQRFMSFKNNPPRSQ